MSDFSKLPQDVLADALKKGYVGVYFEQGVPILDRDLNLLADLVAANVRALAGRYIGDGVAGQGAAFAIAASAPPADNTFRITGGGRCLVGGIEVAIGADVDYHKQKPAPDDLSTPTANRRDTVYLDVSLTTVDGSAIGDTELNNAADVGMRTSVRVKPTWTVRVVEGEETAPDPVEPGHAHYALAWLDRPANQARVTDAMITDLRQTRLNLDDLERRMRDVERLRVLPVLADPPNEFEPKNAFPDGEVTIFGRNLDLAPVEVQFGSFRAAKVRIGDAGKVVATIPQAATGLVPITVTTKGGVVTTKDAFTVRGSGPAPAFNAAPNEFDPKAGGPDTTVTLFGTNLNLDPVAVLFGTMSAQIVTPGPNQVAVKVPAGVVGAVVITITTRSGKAVSTTKFTAGATPSLAAEPLEPRSGGVGAEVKITGTNLSVAPVTVEFSGVRAETLEVTPALIRVKVPSGAPVRSTVKVTTGVGTATSPVAFTVLGGA